MAVKREMDENKGGFVFLLQSFAITDTFVLISNLFACSLFKTNTRVLPIIHPDLAALETKHEHKMEAGFRLGIISGHAKCFFCI